MRVACSIMSGVEDRRSKEQADEKGIPVRVGSRAAAGSAGRRCRPRDQHRLGAGGNGDPDGGAGAAGGRGEQRDFLGGRGRYDRRGEGQAGSRNGYERGRLRTAEGFVDVAVPQVRGAAEPFRSSLMGFLDGNSEVLESLVNEMYARGLSTRDVEDAFRDATGELLISKSAVSEITDRLWEDYQAFITRDLSDLELEYLFVDAVFESLRRHGAKEALLVGWGIAADGGKHLLHLAVGNKESEACWTEFFRHLLGRGLRLPTTITSDGAPGLVKAIHVCFPASIRIRCWFHRLANIRAKLPDEAAAEVMAHVYAVRDAPTLDAARAAADRLIAG